MRAPERIAWLSAFAAAGLSSANAQLTDEEMKQLEARLPAAASVQVDFDEHIRPIFENACLRCHGPERPKSRFRLDSRERALAGGASGIDIVPGQSARSPLIYYVAHLVEAMEMPPEGEGDPLTNEEVALLRAWIDQGVVWGTTQTNKTLFSISPSVQFISVEGNERKFREHTGIKDGWNGGASIFVEQPLGTDRTLTFDARVFPNPEEYRFRLQVEQRELGFVRFGFEQYREFYDDTGGFHPAFTPPSFSLHRDLHVDIGRAWAEFGLTVPDWPRVVVGYEFRYRDGAKSILEVTKIEFNK